MKFHLLYVAFLAIFFFSINQFLEQPIWDTRKPVDTTVVNPNFEKRFPSLTEKNVKSIGYHYQVITYHYSKPEIQNTRPKRLHRNDEAIKSYYDKLTESENKLNVSLGRFGKALIKCYEKDYMAKLWKLDSNSVIFGVYEKEARFAKQKYYNLAVGKIYSEAIVLRTPAINAFKDEIKVKGDTASAYVELIKIWYKQKDFDELYKVAQNPVLLRYFKEVKPKILIETYFVKGDFLKYLPLRLRIKTNYIGILASLFITITWFLYLVRLKVFRKRHYVSMVSSLIGGSLFAFLALPIYDFYHLNLNFHLKGYLFNDFPYMILGIGLIEETVKLIPFLLVARFFSKAIQEPVDYLILASASALGFAATENFIYIAKDSQVIVQLRAFIPTISHLFDSSIIAFGIIIAKYRRKRPVWIYVLLYLLIAATMHGLYDFWLYAGIYLFSFAIMLVGMAMWITFLNNGLNISPNFNYQKIFSSARLRKFLILALTGIVLFDYGSTAMLKGVATANIELRFTLFFTSFFMIFLFTSLANFDLVKGYWHPVYKTSFFKKVNYNRFIGTWVTIQPKFPSHMIDPPEKIQINERYVFGDQTNYFGVQLTQPIEIEGQLVSYLFLQLKYKKTFFSTKEKNHTTLFYPKDEQWKNHDQPQVYPKQILKSWTRASVEKVEG